ncbi:hypothetical protein L1887_18449 [Cichorium endivia]|nr:hypothetical protein L1887_18449 [Cichorium endivia]
MNASFKFTKLDVYNKSGGVVFFIGMYSIYINKLVNMAKDRILDKNKKTTLKKGDPQPPMPGCSGGAVGSGPAQPPNSKNGRWSRHLSFHPLLFLLMVRTLCTAQVSLPHHLTARSPSQPHASRPHPLHPPFYQFTPNAKRQTFITPPPPPPTASVFLLPSHRF